MGRRIEVELTSARDDGSWTWRAAGARQPKGDLSGSLLPEGAKVGDVLKVDAEFHVDGIEIVEVFAPKQKKERTNLLELKSRPLRDDELVTTQRVQRSGGRGGGRRNDRKGGRRDRNDGGRRHERQAEAASQRPRPKRLKPRREHRNALLAKVDEVHRPIVEQVIRDGMPGVRAAIEKQNAEAKEAGKPEIDPTPILSIAEKNLQPARLAEWRDRADAAMAIVDELDLRDLRSVVVAGSDLARDPESRELADKLKTALNERVETDHTQWLEDLDAAVSQGRVVRALRLSSRPVKAGAPLPAEMASSLSAQAAEALAADVGQERWATVLDALAFSPVRGAVTPAGIPESPKEPLLDAVKRLSEYIPAIAKMFGIDPADVPRSAKRHRSGRPPRNKGGAKGAKKGNAKSRNRNNGTAKTDAKATDSKPKDSKPKSETADAKADTSPAEETKVVADVDTETVEAPSEQPVSNAPAAEVPAAETAAETPAANVPAEQTATEEAPAEEPVPAES